MSEININNSSSFVEFFDSDHLVHENKILRKMLREKDEEIFKLKTKIELINVYSKVNRVERNPPFGT